MSKIEDLIKQYCPDGVEYVELGDIVEFLNGRAYKQSELLDEGKYKVLRVGNFHTNDKWYYSNFELDKTKYCDSGDLLYTWAATLGPQIWNGGKSIYHYHIWKLMFDEEIISKRFLYHFLAMDTENISKSLTNSTMPHVSMANMKKRIIPVPPRPVQDEIVRILDKFTELEKELEKELKLRRKQYEWYRDELLTFGDDVEYKSLKDLYEYRRGSFPQPYTNMSFYGGDNAAPFVQVADVCDDGFCLADKTKQTISKIAQPKSVFVKKGTVIVTLQGTIGRVAITQYDAYVDRTLAIFTKCKVSDLNKQYFSYCLKSIFDEKKKLARGSTIKTITKEEFSEFVIPVPSPTEQERIVKILDKFDTLTTSLTSGLPAEIKLRKQQYEYYRDYLFGLLR